MKGIHGRYLDVDLSSGSTAPYEIPGDWYRRYLGGRGIGVRLLLEEMSGREDPLGPQNILVFVTGPLQGSLLGGAGRHGVISMSPKTNSLSDTYAGGYFGHELARSGYDGVLIRGRAARPTYLACIDGQVSLEDATDLWGLTTAETEMRLLRRYPGARVTSIGVAGENTVRFACLINDGGRAAARPGFGAVMGSKRLKAVVIKGSTPKPVHAPEALARVRREIVSRLSDDEGKDMRARGTARSVLPLNEMGILPTRNFQDGVFSGVGGIGFEAYSRILVGPATCVGCPAWCKNVVKTQFDGKEVRGPGPEYETLAALGSLCLNNDLDAVALANQKCNLYGLDTISTGVTIAFAMEAAERGLLRGYNIKWGDAQRILSLIDEIATRQGVGDALADGVARLSAEMGVDFAQEVKGQEIALHEPRGKKGFALSVATSPQGGHHTQGMHDHSFQTTPVAEELGISGCVDPLSFDKQAEVVKTYEDLMSFTDSCILCRFTSFNRTGRRYLYPQVREALYAVTGIEMSAREMLATGERNYLLLRLAANAAGYGREHDRLPRRMHTPLPSGPLAGTAIGEEELSLAIDAYYSARGYDPLGRPMSDKLRELGIDVTGYRKL